MKFVNRGVYFINDGEYKGSFIMNIKECDVGDQKALMMLPDQEKLMLPSEKVKQLFEEGHFDYVKTIPKKYYNACVTQFKGVEK